MIYPKVVNTKKGHALAWTGVLIDWASSKPIIGDNEPHHARQPAFMVRGACLFYPENAGC